MEITASIISETPDIQLSISGEIIYAHRETRDLHMQIVSPSRIVRPQNSGKEKPLIVEGVELPGRHNDGKRQPPGRSIPKSPAVILVPGSGFDGVRGIAVQEIDTAVNLAQRGFTAAIIEYRGSYFDDAHYPAYAQDVKEAVRFLRANAEEYGVDPDHIALLGGSSGGHAVAMAGLTPGEEIFDIGDNLNQSSEVNAVICFFGPVDPQDLLADRMEEHKQLRPGEKNYPFEAYEIYAEEFEKDIEKHLFESSVSNHIRNDVKLPALACFTGDKDGLIPLRQGLRLCQNVRDAGGVSEFYRIIGGEHGRGCFFERTYELISKFLRLYI
ncbi:MAG: alpha/beta hydrolase [Lachnospiraceae bacterium]|nr:alpha/beta hydrolase [Lachnospiraceae bacterium]